MKESPKAVENESRFANGDVGHYDEEEEGAEDLPSRGRGSMGQGYGPPMHSHGAPHMHDMDYGT